MNIDIIGGDIRQLQLEKELKNRGINVTTYGLKSQDMNYENNSKVVILPIPFSKDGQFVFTPLTKSFITTEKVFSELEKAETVIGGKVSKYGYTDILCREDYAQKNAELTAEAAITAAVSESGKALLGNKILIVGYGRIGKILASILKGYNARVTVSARKQSDFALANINGFEYVDTSKIADCIGNFSVIFNTVEAPVLNSNVLSKADCGAYVFELASNNAGVDMNFAKENEINCFSLPGLPAKYFPQNAAKVYTDTVLEILKEKNYL